MINRHFMSFMCPDTSEERSGFRFFFYNNISITDEIVALNMKYSCCLVLLLFSFGRCDGQNKPDLHIDLSIIDHQYCPDAIKQFPPINIRSWKKTPVINGRLPTWEETENGKSITYIDKNVNPDLKDAKPYKMILPKLASIINPDTHKSEVVVVIQMIRFTKYVYVGYRFLSGGIGSCTLGQCHFLTESEVKKAIKQ